MNRPSLRLFALGYVALAALSWMNSSANADTKGGALAAAEGLWAYTTLQAGGKGEEMPLTGVILFKNGVFAQQSIFDGQPFETQGAMAHAGPYGSGPKGIHMVAEQTISIAPGKEPPLKFRRDTQHDISVAGAGDDLTIVFGSGTTQKFKRIGPGAGEIHELANGVLAFVDGHFVLVSGDEKAVVTGFGKYKQAGTAYTLDVIRWSEATTSSASNRRDVSLKATFDGTTFALADGRTFRVVTPKK